MNHLFEKFINMVEDAVEAETQISVWQENNDYNVAYSFIPYECNFVEDKIYIEGECCILNIRDISKSDLSYDEMENEFKISINGCNIYIKNI